MLRPVLVCLLLVACGPSSKEIRTARTAHYTLPGSEVFDAVVEAAEAKYKIREVDDIEGWLITDGTWYAPEGGAEPKSADGGQFVGDRSVLFALEIHVRGTEGDWTVEVIPRAMQNVGGSHQARELAPDDPAMPGWAKGRVNSMYVAIHKRLKGKQAAATP